jgi:hypothetical protein
MRLHKIRKIAIYPNGTYCLGLSLPNYLADKWINTNVIVKESGNFIILYSGAMPVEFTKKEIKNDSKVLEKFRL